MTRTDGIRGSGSDDKRDQWHMHMTRTDDSRGTDSDDQSDLFYTYDWYKWQ